MTTSDDPVRLAASGSDAPEVLRIALREGDALPTSSQLDSLASKLGPLMGAAVGGAAVGVATSSATAGSVASGGATAGLGAKVLAGVVLAGAIAGGGVWVAQRSSTSGVSPKTPPAAIEPAHAAQPSADNAATGNPAVRSDRTPAPAPGAPASQARASVSKEKEAALLDAAQRLLPTNPERALALTRAHRQRFPSGALAQEREVIAIEALSLLGRKDDAKRLSEDFERAYPGSAHQRKVESAVQP